jgi:hypothetical protein
MSVRNLSRDPQTVGGAAKPPIVDKAFVDRRLPLIAPGRRESSLGLRRRRNKRTVIAA